MMELSKLNKYEIANKKVEIIRRVYKLRKQYKEELKNYLGQTFILLPEKIQISEEEYNFDNQTLIVGNRKVGLSLDEAKKIFSEGMGELGSRKIECSLIRKVKMDVEDKNKTWALDNSKIKILQEQILNKENKVMFSFDYNSKDHKDIFHLYR